MNDIADIMSAVTNCTVAGIKAGKSIGQDERDRLQRERDEAVRLLMMLVNELTTGIEINGNPIGIRVPSKGAVDEARAFLSRVSK